MCGIDVVVTLRKQSLTDVSETFFDSTTSIQPGCSDTRRAMFTASRGPDFSNRVTKECDEYVLDMFSSVLQVQGAEICKQQSCLNGSYLLWNGEYLNHSVSDESDTCMIMTMLSMGTSPAAVLNGVEGPFAFVYYDNTTHSVWFGKDKQGRRSLMLNLTENQICISSTSFGVEIPAGLGIFKLDLLSSVLSFHSYSDPIPYLSPSFFASKSPSLITPAHINATLSTSIARHMQISTVSAPLGVLFSGGLDSMIIASIAASHWDSIRFPSIDLINVASEPDCPDRLTGLVSFSELLEKFPRVVFRFIAVDIDSAEILEHTNRISSLIAPLSTHMDFNIGSALWFGSRGEGRILSPDFVSAPEWPGLLQRIVSQESLQAASDNRTSKITDTSTGECLICECRKRKPGCENFACKFCCKTCTVHAKRIVLPAKLEIEFLTSYLSSTREKSNCRILLLGHGADELFGGYGRHETRIRKGGDLREEMILDLSRLWTRNLGRDDRVVADHARDARHPFLDEALVQLMGEENLAEIASNKAKLREMAQIELKLKFAPIFRKRAIQFGTRLAQKANIASFGSHSKGKGTSEY